MFCTPGNYAFPLHSAFVLYGILFCRVHCDKTSPFWRSYRASIASCLDLISSGEELFAPVSQKRFRIPFAVKTGGIMDHVLRYASFVGILYIATYIILGDNPLQIISLIVS